jgi:recombination protein RecA
LGQGKEKARAYLLENPELCEEIRDLVMSAGGYAGPEGEAAVAEVAAAESEPEEVAAES